MSLSNHNRSNDMLIKTLTDYKYLAYNNNMIEMINFLRNRPLTFGILTAEIGYNESFKIAGSKDAAKKLGINLIIFSGKLIQSTQNYYTQEIIFDFIRSDKIDGLIIWTGALNWFLNEEQTNAFFSRYKPMPMISLEAPLEGISSIMMDDFQGMKDVVSHLIEEHGLKKIAFLRGIEGHFGARERYRGYVEALKENNIEIDDYLISPVSMAWNNLESIKILLDDRKAKFEAVAMANTVGLFEIMNFLESRKIKIPRDFAIVGFDNNPVSKIIKSPLTIVEPPFYKMGQRAVELLSEKIKGNTVPDIENIKPELIIRRSCGCFSIPFIKAEVFNEDNSRLFQNNESIFSMLDEEIKNSIGKTVYEINRDGYDILYEAFLTQVKDEKNKNFFVILEDFLDKTASDLGDLNAWQAVLSMVRIKSINDSSVNMLSLRNIENIISQSRAMISEAAFGNIEKMQIQNGMLASLVNSICQELLINFDMDKIMDVAVNEFPKLNISSCYISIYNNPEKPAESSRLIMAYNKNGRVNLKPKGITFPTSKIIPDEILLKGKINDLLVMDLYFQNEQIGFIVFGYGAKDIQIYETLRRTISSSLKGALLVGQINDHLKQLSKSNSRLDKLNKRLKENQKKLLASEKRASDEANLLNTLLDTSPDYIFAKDINSRFIRSNQSLLQQMGAKSIDDLIGKTDFDFYPKELAEKYYADEQTIFQTGKPIVNHEEPNIDPEGNYEFHLTTKVLMRDEKENIFGLLGISRDITDIKIKEEAIIHERNLLRTLIDNLPDHIYAKDVDGRFILANVAVARHMGGKKPEDLLGKTDFDFYKRALAEKFNTDEKMLIQSGKPLLYHEEYNRDPVGNIVWTLTTKVVLHDSQGKAIGLIGIGRNITDIKEARGNLENAYKNLKENQEKLLIYSEKLEKSNKELDQFAYIVSHDLQEPLRKIQFFGDRLITNYDKILDNKASDYIERMKNAAFRMGKFIDGLLQYSRVTRMEKQFESIDLNELIKEVIDDLEVRIIETRTKINIDKLPDIIADPLQIKQVFQNIISNSLKFHREKISPVINITSKITDEDNNSFYEIIISDNGIGFDNAYADKIFVLFQRLHGRSEYEGTGIGLAICKKIIEQHDGIISATGKEGEGSSFLIKLPLIKKVN